MGCTLQVVFVSIEPEPAPEEREAILAALAEEPPPQERAWGAAALAEAVEQDEPEP